MNNPRTEQVFTSTVSRLGLPYDRASALDALLAAGWTVKNHTINLTGDDKHFSGLAVFVLVSPASV